MRCMSQELLEPALQASLAERMANLESEAGRGKKMALQLFLFTYRKGADFEPGGQDASQAERARSTEGGAESTDRSECLGP